MIRRLLRGIRPVWLHAKLAYLRRARAEMGGLHPDLPDCVHEIRNIERELAGQS